MDEFNISDFDMRVSIVFNPIFKDIIAEFTNSKILNNDVMNEKATVWVRDLLAKNLKDDKDVTEYRYRVSDGFLNGMKHTVKLKALKFSKDPLTGILFFSNTFELHYKGVGELKGNSGKITGELIIQLVKK